VLLLTHTHTQLVGWFEFNVPFQIVEVELISEMNTHTHTLSSYKL